ncbi:DNA polymerase-3 subunit epsilon [Thermodesulfovibrio aggregans]|uniref:DNA polymerase-3 subunit epsilon n=1 Tax=Thermodesulfovibrio aggregans TaxID=86166 RepID=A0A0U9HQB5_9BACT|nr:3'-5' exonuclease [Thermodesulfovibrio aggregans]GAQ95179.1 DNA polymerase-3 subunit epsilon [Thermodesulfovibrio aggregans]
MIKLFRKRIEKKVILEQPISETDFVIVDTELTGLNEFKDNIIAIGAIKMRGKTIKIGEVFYRTVSPSTNKFRKESIMIHEITPSELEKCPRIEPILREFMRFSKNCIFVGHCLDVDLVFLKKEIRSNLRETFDPDGLDTLLIYKWLIKKGVLPSHFENKNSLEDIALSLGVEARELHDALSDAFITAQIFQKLLSYLGEFKIFTVGELLKIGSIHTKSLTDMMKKEAYQL